MQKKRTMKKKYTKKQIVEAIAYWKKKMFLMEASGAQPFLVGNAVVEKTMDGLKNMLYNSEIIDANEIDNAYLANPKKVYIANVGSRGIPGDILVVFKDFTTKQRVDIVLEVKSSQASSLFQFTWQTGYSNESNAQRTFIKNYPDQARKISQNISDFAIAYMFVNDKTQRDKALLLASSVEQPALQLDMDDLTAQNVSKTLDFIMNYDDSDEMAAKYGLSAYSHKKADKNYRPFLGISSDGKRKIFAKMIFNLRKLLRNGGKSIAFCEPFTIDIDLVKDHFSNCDYMRIGPFMYSVNGKNPLKIKRKGKPIKTIDQNFNQAKMTCYLRKPSSKSPKFRIICSFYNLYMNDGYEISFDDPANKPDKQYALVGVNMNHH